MHEDDIEQLRERIQNGGQVRNRDLADTQFVILQIVRDDISGLKKDLGGRLARLEIQVTTLQTRATTEDALAAVKRTAHDVRMRVLVAVLGSVTGITLLFTWLADLLHLAR